MTAPANDDFAAAERLAATGTTTGTNVGATSEAGEPSPGIGIGASVWYRWTAPRTGWFRFDLAGSTFDTIITVYTGSALGALTQVAFNDDNPYLTPFQPGGLQSLVEFAAVADTVYSVCVDGYDTGDMAMRWGERTGRFTDWITPDPLEYFGNPTGYDITTRRAVSSAAATSAAEHAVFDTLWAQAVVGDGSLGQSSIVSGGSGGLGGGSYALTRSGIYDPALLDPVFQQAEAGYGVQLNEFGVSHHHGYWNEGWSHLLKLLPNEFPEWSALVRGVDFDQIPGKWLAFPVYTDLNEQEAFDGSLADTDDGRGSAWLEYETIPRFTNVWITDSGHLYVALAPGATWQHSADVTESYFRVESITPAPYVDGIISGSGTWDTTTGTLVSTIHATPVGITGWVDEEHLVDPVTEKIAFKILPPNFHETTAPLPVPLPGDPTFPNDGYNIAESVIPVLLRTSILVQLPRFRYWVGAWAGDP